jgi:hypothetical protein
MSNKVTRVYQDGKKLTLEEIVGKLTPKQRKFAEGLVFGGLSKAEAYRQAYKWNGNANAGRVQSVKVSKKPNVAVAIQAMEAERMASWWEDKTKLRKFVMDGLTNTATNTDSDITRLKALELVGKTRYASIFEEPSANESNTELNKSLGDVLRAKLTMLLGNIETHGDNSLTTTYSDVTNIDGDSGPGGLTLEAVAEDPTGVGEGE